MGEGSPVSNPEYGWFLYLTLISALFLAGRCLEAFQSALGDLVLKTVVFFT